MEVRSTTSEEKAILGRRASVLFLENDFLVAVRDGEIASFLVWRRIAPDECEILQLETLAPFRRLGLARRLLLELEKHNPGILFLEVRPSNHAARQLYESYGFIEIGIRQNYYADPVEDAIVLKFRPC